MMKEYQKRTKQVNVYLNEKEHSLVNSYLASLDDYMPCSEVFRIALLEKINNETKNQTKE